MANAYTLSPAPFQKFFLANGEPAANGRVFTFLAGLSTPATTYRDSIGTPNSNPIHLDGAGQCSIFLATGSYGYIVYAEPLVAGLDTSGGLIETQDNITAVGGNASSLTVQGIAGETIIDGQCCYLSQGSGGKTSGRWYLAKADNAYSSLDPEVGFCIGGVASGSTGVFLLGGQVSSGLSLTVGSTYYISSATFGDIVFTAPTNARPVGVADSGTSLIAFPNPPNPGQISGTWTPVLGGSGGTTGQAYTIQVGDYVKIGRLVYASFQILLSNKGTITANCQIQGLPFSSGSSNLNAVSPIAWSGTVSSLVTLLGFIAPGTTAATLFGTTAAATALSILTTADIGNTTLLNGTIIYKSAT